MQIKCLYTLVNFYTAKTGNLKQWQSHWILHFHYGLCFYALIHHQEIHNRVRTRETISCLFYCTAHAHYLHSDLLLPLHSDFPVFFLHIMLCPQVLLFTYIHMLLPRFCIWGRTCGTLLLTKLAIRPISVTWTQESYVFSFLSTWKEKL